jgi:hypothetical protein
MYQKAAKVANCTICGDRGWKPDPSGDAVLCECAKVRYRRMKRLRARLPVDGYQLSSKQKGFLAKLREKQGSFILASKHYELAQAMAGAFLDEAIVSGQSGIYCGVPIQESEFGDFLRKAIAVVDTSGLDGFVRERLRLGLATVVVSTLGDLKTVSGRFGMPVVIYD